MLEDIKETDSLKDEQKEVGKKYYRVRVEEGWY